MDRFGALRPLARSHDGRWLLLFAAARAVCIAIAAVLVAWDGPSATEMAGLAFAVAMTLALIRHERVRRSPPAWAVDSAGVLGLIVASNDWRSPYYLLWLTTLALPAIRLPRVAAVWLAFAAPVAFLLVAVFGGPAPGHLGPVSSETLAIHVALPFFCVSALAYAQDIFGRLQAERAERERLAIEAERRRIAWELHDSAKQRVHAAHLLVSSLEHRAPPELAFPLQRAIAELESTVADMDTSLAELRSPLEGRPLHEALRARAEEMAGSTTAAVAVTGTAPELPPLVAAHAYRVGCEALTNALRHAAADRIDVTVGAADGRLVLSVVDDGVGLPAEPRAAATGLMAMESRAGTIGGRLHIGAGPDGRGTRVTLEAPTTTPGGTP